MHRIRLSHGARIYPPAGRRLASVAAADVLGRGARRGGGRALEYLAKLWSCVWPWRGRSVG